jgi:hypothetical protein
MPPTRRSLRKLTVTTKKTWPHYRTVPQVRMTGNWLARAGFTPGTWLDVMASEGMLVITVARPAGLPKPEQIQEVMETLQEEYGRRFPKRRSKRQSVPRSTIDRYGQGTSHLRDGSLSPVHGLHLSAVRKEPARGDRPPLRQHRQVPLWTN